MLKLYALMAIKERYVLKAIMDKLLFDRYFKQRGCPGWEGISWEFDDLTDESNCLATVQYYFNNGHPTIVCYKSCEFPGNYNSKLCLYLPSQLLYYTLYTEKTCI